MPGKSMFEKKKSNMASESKRLQSPFKYFIQKTFILLVVKDAAIRRKLMRHSQGL